jgi:hypothetical protein
MARERGLVAFDTETTSLDAMQAELVGFSLALPETAPDTGDLRVRACYAPLMHSNGAGDLLGGGGAQAGQMPMQEALSELKALLEDPAVLKIGQNLKYDMLVMAQHGISIESFDDTMLLSYVLEAGAGGHGMDSLSERWLGHTTIAYKDVTGSGKNAIPFAEVQIDKATAYAAEDAEVTLRLWHVLKPRLVADGVASVYERLERPLAPVLMRMEKHGIRVDRQILSRLSGELAQGAAALEAEIQELAGENFNVGSPRQLGEILFDKMSLPGGTKTKTGQWSTTAQALEDLAAAGHELPRKIVDWRQLTKLKSTYTDALPGFINPETKRVHTSFAMAATTTGRLSSSDPNIQNIPVRTAAGRKIRTAFIAEPGNVLISADYSQIELRVLAHVADIPQLTQAFRRRRRHSRHDSFGNVRGAGGGHAIGSPPPRQGDQFRHHLRHLRLRSRQPARHRALGGGRLHQEVFRAFPGYQGLHGGHQGGSQGIRLREDDLRAPGTLSRDQVVQPAGARLQRARSDQCADPGIGRRYHPPRHGADGAGAGKGRQESPHAVAGARRTDLRGCRGRRRIDHSGDRRGDGKRRHAGGQHGGAAQG